MVACRVCLQRHVSLGYLNIIANISDFNWSTFGPTESDISFLSDRRTLICVIRMDGDANCDTQLYRYFYSARSSDGGRSWSKPAPMQGLGCVRPKLLLLDDGALLLAGGRMCVEQTKDILLWVFSRRKCGRMGLIFLDLPAQSPVAW